MVLDEDTQRALGLQNSALEPIGSLAWPTDDVGHGRGPMARKETVAAVLASLFLPMGVPSESVGGFLANAQGHARVIEFQPEPGKTVSAVRASASDASTPVLWQSPDRVVLDLQQARAVSIELSDGRSFVLVAGDALELLLAEPQLDLAPPAALPRFVSDQQIATSDPWLAERLQFQLSLADSWHSGVASGLALRFHNEGGAQNGVAAENDFASLRWVRALSNAERAALARRSLAHLDGLWTQLELLDERSDYPDEDWQHMLLDLCRRRDDLEGVIILLDRIDKGREVRDAVASLDRVAGRLIRKVDGRVITDDEQLRRASCDLPMAWWTSLVPWPRELPYVEDPVG